LSFGRWSSPWTARFPSLLHPSASRPFTRCSCLWRRWSARTPDTSPAIHSRSTCSTQRSAMWSTSTLHSSKSTVGFSFFHFFSFFFFCSSRAIRQRFFRCSDRSYYGVLGTVLDYAPNALVVRLTVPPRERLDLARQALDQHYSVPYLPLPTVSKRVGFTKKVVSKVPTLFLFDCGVFICWFCCCILKMHPSGRLHPRPC